MTTTENALTATAPYSTLSASDFAPYHTMPDFQTGFADYQAGKAWAEYRNGVAAQAYQRGTLFAMKLARARDWAEQNVGAN